MPLVSVVIPVYNVEKYILRCINSIQQQSLDNIEIIVVDDYTPDNSMSIVKELAENDNRIKILAHEKNMGLMWTRRTGYMVATGDYLAFCDSDDCLPPTAIENLYRAAMTSDADIVCGNHLYITTKGEIIKHKNDLRYGTSPVGVLKSLLCHEMTHTLWGKLFKASLFHDYEYKTYEHVTNGEDGCLFYQVVRNMNKTILIDDYVYHYMQNLESSTQRRLNDNAINSICILNKTRDNIISSYPELYDDLNRYITNILCIFYVLGYNKGNTQLYKHIKENGLRHYVSFSNLMKYLNYGQILKLIIRYKILKLK